MTIENPWPGIAHPQLTRAQALDWFAGAKFGLFLHYGLYSLLGRGEWVMFQEKIHVAEYEKLKADFKAEAFDAAAIADLAVAAGMSYITLTTRHHDSFCLFETQQTDFNSVQSPCGRDLTGELAQACRERGLGFFLYYSYGVDWRHPYFYPRDNEKSFARPDYAHPEPAYLWQQDSDFRHYIDFMHAQLRELLTQYGPIAGLWFDPIMPVYLRHELFPIEETYALIRELQPGCLISFKQGANGDEDFGAPEFSVYPLDERVRKMGGSASAIEIARLSWEKNKDKHNEICATMHPKWGYVQGPDADHKTPGDVMAMLANAANFNCNLLLNTGLMPGGSIQAIDAATLREVGAHLKRDGFPQPAHAAPALVTGEGLA